MEDDGWMVVVAFLVLAVAAFGFCGCGDDVAADYSGTYAYEWPTHAPDGGPLTYHGTMTLTREGGQVDCPDEMVADWGALWNWRVSGPVEKMLLASDHAVWDDDFILKLAPTPDGLAGPMVPSVAPEDEHRGYVFRMVRR